MPMLRELFSFEKRAENSDGAGNYAKGWEHQFSCRADIIYREGSESVIAARLEKRIPAFLKIRKAMQTDRITHEWRCKDDRTGQFYNIRAKTPDTKTKRYYFLTLEGGVAT